MKSWIVLIGLLMCAPLRAQRGAMQPAAAPGFPTRVMIVSFDGLRPDVALRADMPHLRSLTARGSFTFWAHTTPVAITLPSHTSMLTGVTPEKHGIHWNDDKPENRPEFPQVPTLFQLAKKQGRTTAVVAGKSKFRVFDAPGALDWKFIKETGDDDVAEAAAAIVHEHQPDVLFIHFPDCDRVGHDKGWGTPQQVDAVSHADKEFGRVLDALEEEHLTDKTLIIVSADHGGNGRTHGGPDPRSQHIPWIAAGPGIKMNYDLTRIQPLVVATYDTFATACFALGIPLPEHIDGKPVAAIFAQAELLNAAP
jgi:predicted AlkP superfamily pyrophosphatase or phosphodiesterase